MDTGSTATDVNTHRDSLTQGGVDVPVAPKAHRIVGPKGNSLPNHGRTIPSLYFAWIWDPISRFNGGFHAYPTTIDVPMLGRDATRVSTIQGGSASQLHLGSIVIHLENPRGTNFSKWYACFTHTHTHGVFIEWESFKSSFYFICRKTSILYIFRGFSSDLGWGNSGYLFLLCHGYSSCLAKTITSITM